MPCLPNFQSFTEGERLQASKSCSRGDDSGTVAFLLSAGRLLREDTSKSLLRSSGALQQGHFWCRVKCRSLHFWCRVQCRSLKCV
ncbi:hypothetical protein KC19_VG324300 [Ceratodon purpureus]|uniref:Uncharacterized protein n=1 Tax=Ceratodon purpureus TaxID=3225 RepID=A0A8T0HVV4_CERPU|nr:hypothetical protein KC19_VG324300 [Ceratodon purpureus]